MSWDWNAHGRDMFELTDHDGDQLAMLCRGWGSHPEVFGRDLHAPRPWAVRLRDSDEWEDLEPGLSPAEARAEAERMLEAVDE